MSTALTPESPETAALIPQPHGGALRSGGKPGNKGGSKPPSIVRKACRKGFYARIPLLKRIADNEAVDIKERLRAVEMLGRFGLSGAITWDDIRSRLKAQVEILRAALPAEQVEPILAELSRIWK